MDSHQVNEEIIKKAIEIVGGANKLAKEIGVSYHTILAWKNGRTGITFTNCIKIEKSTKGKIKRQEIMPYYNWDEAKIDERKDEKLEIANKMLEKKMDKEIIAEITGLSVEEIEKLED